MIPHFILFISYILYFRDDTRRAGRGLFQCVQNVVLSDSTDRKSIHQIHLIGTTEKLSRGKVTRFEKKRDNFKDHFNFPSHGSDHVCCPLLQCLTLSTVESTRYLFSSLPSGCQEDLNYVVKQNCLRKKGRAIQPETRQLMARKSWCL